MIPFGCFVLAFSCRSGCNMPSVSTCLVSWIKVMSDLLVSLLKEDLNEELYMAREAGLGLDLYLTKVDFGPKKLAFILRLNEPLFFCFFVVSCFLAYAVYWCERTYTRSCTWPGRRASSTSTSISPITFPGHTRCSTLHWPIYNTLSRRLFPFSFFLKCTYLFHFHPLRFFSFSFFHVFVLVFTSCFVFCFQLFRFCSFFFIFFVIFPHFCFCHLPSFSVLIFNV